MDFPPYKWCAEFSTSLKEREIVSSLGEQLKIMPLILNSPFTYAFLSDNLHTCICSFVMKAT
jgi:hypothetical protein